MARSSREAVRVGARVSALEMDLVRPHAVELHQKLAVERESAVLADVQLRQPAADAVRIELLVPRAIERVGQIDPPAVVADLDHLRTAVQRSIRLRGVRATADDAAEPHGAGLDRIERI